MIASDDSDDYDVIVMMVVIVIKKDYDDDDDDDDDICMNVFLDINKYVCVYYQFLSSYSLHHIMIYSYSSTLRCIFMQ